MDSNVSILIWILAAYKAASYILLYMEDNALLQVMIEIKIILKKSYMECWNTYTIFNCNL